MCMCVYIGEGTWTSGVRLGVCVRVYDSDTEDAHVDIRAYAPMEAFTHALCVGAACFAAWAWLLPLLAAATFVLTQPVGV